MSRVRVGLSHLQGKPAIYAEKFDIVEVRPVDITMPKLSKLAKWRELVPPAFAFSVVLPRAVAKFDDPGDEALTQALDVARVLQASTIVLSTMAQIRPTKKNRERIADLVKKLPADAQTVVWHAAGMWEVEDVMATAAASGALPVFDATVEPLPPGPIVYTRIRALGHNSSSIGADRINLIAHQVAGRREASVIVEGDQAKKIRAELQNALSRLNGGGQTSSMFAPQVFTPGDEEQ